MLGPLLRYVGETEATIWLEADRACQAEILGHQARTFEVSGWAGVFGMATRPAARRQRAGTSSARRRCSMIRQRSST